MSPKRHNLLQAGIKKQLARKKFVSNHLTGSVADRILQQFPSKKGVNSTMNGAVFIGSSSKSLWKAVDEEREQMERENIFLLKRLNFAMSRR